jgi:hypothetical protein
MLDAMRYVTSIVVALSMLALAACDEGSGNDAPEATPAPDDDAIARSMLLKRADFPETWVQTPSPDRDSPYTRCDTAMDGRSGRAASAQYRKEEIALSQVVLLYEDAASAQQVPATLTAQAECYRDVINFGDADTFDTELMEAVVSPLALPDAGGAAVRLAFSFRVKSLPPPLVGEELPEGYIDFVAAVDGRAAFVLQAYGANAPMDPEELAVYYNTARERLRENQPVSEPQTSRGSGDRARTLR